MLLTYHQPYQLPKSDITSAISEKGGGASGGFEAFPNAIRNIPSGGTAPSKGFVPTAWGENGCFTKGVFYGSDVPRGYFGTNQGIYGVISSKLTEIDFQTGGNPLSVNERSFQNCEELNIANLPILAKAGQYAFSASKTASITIRTTPTAVLEYGAFGNMPNLKTVYFLTKPQYITNSFYKDDQLTDIYVPWAEGTLSGAPWGATNATIHYNYVPDM